MRISNIRLNLVLCNENPYTDVYEDFHYSVPYAFRKDFGQRKDNICQKW